MGSEREGIPLALRKFCRKARLGEEHKGMEDTAGGILMLGHCKRISLSNMYKNNPLVGNRQVGMLCYFTASRNSDKYNIAIYILRA